MPNEIKTQTPQKEIATLGDGQVFIRRTTSGAIKAIKAKMTLKESKGHLAVIQNKVSVTAAGFYELNKVAGISIITPEKLTLPDGSVVTNPFPILDPQSGTISKVWVKKMAVGYGPTGNIVITSSTLLYDIAMYFIQDMVKKIKYNAKAGKFCIESVLTKEEKETGIFLKIEGAIGVWANLKEKDAQTCLETFVQNKLYAERKAQTIAERNCLKKHPSLAISIVDNQGTENNHYASVDVIGYTHDLSQNDLEKLANEAAEGNINNFKGTPVDITDANIIDDITEEDFHTAVEEDETVIPPIDNEGKESSNEKSVKDSSNKTDKRPPEAAEKLELLTYLVESISIIGKEIFEKNINVKFGNKPLEQLNIIQLKAAKNIVNSLIDNSAVQVF